MSEVSSEEIAWAAGLFEGEGCFTASRQTRPSGKKYIQLVARINMTDLDVLETFRDIMPVGRLIEFTSVDTRHKSCKQMWTWYTTNTGDFAEVFMILEPWLHRRRTKKAIELMEEWHCSHQERRQQDAVSAEKILRALDQGRSRILSPSS